MDSGWVKLNRSLIESPLWNDINTFRLYVLLLSKAAHKEIYVAGIKLNKGQYLRSYSKLAEDLAVKEGRGLKKISKSTVSRSIKKLISFGLVAEHETEHGTVFTILEIQEQQGFKEDENTNPEQNMNRTQNEPRTNPERKQELKELKELNNYDVDTNFIFQEFLSLKEQLDQQPPKQNENDLIAIKRLIDKKISKFTILNLMTNCFSYFQENQNGTISSFRYIEKYIINQLENEKKQKAEPKTIDYRKTAYKKRTIRQEIVPEYINNYQQPKNELTKEQEEQLKEQIRNLKVKKPINL